MNISQKEVRDRRQIGHLSKQAVFLVSLIGGLHLIAASTGGAQLSILGAGSHPAVARHIASQKCPDIVYDGLEKSDHVAFEHYSSLLPAYTELTDQLRKAQGY